MGKLSLGRNKSGDEIQINMSPMVDMTFLLLIFFIVTTTFVKESGVEVNRPIAASAQSQKETNIIVAVTKDGARVCPCR